MGKEKVSLKVMLIDYAVNTSAHGIKKLTENNGVFVKIFWLLLLLGAAALILYQVSLLIILYLSRPVLTSTTIDTSKLNYPSVTFCNLNPLLNSKAKDDRIYDPVAKIANYLKIPLDRFDYNDSVIDNLLDTNYTFDTVDFSTNDPLDEALIEFKTELTSAPRDVLERLSQTFNNFVISCQYGGVECGESNFSKTFDSDFGLCYTFPNKTKHPVGLKVHNAGPLYGLNLILNVDQREYLPFITTSAGVRIQVHEFGTKPYLTELGQSLSTGFETQIGVRPILSKRLSEPHGSCDDSGTFESVLDCERQCLEEMISSVCECTRIFDDPNQFIEYCGTNDTFCIKSILALKQSGQIVCEHCISSCRMYSYDSTMSMTRWPASHYDPAVRFKLKKWSATENIDMLSETESRDNLLNVKVYYSELSLQKIEEEPAYEWENLLSDIGGQLGLWLGISVLSVCEVIELFYLLCRNCCKRKSKVDVDE